MNYSGTQGTITAGVLLSTLLFGAGMAQAAPKGFPLEAKATRFIVRLKGDSPLLRRSVRLALRGKVLRLGRTLADVDCAIVEATPQQARRLASDPRVLTLSEDRAVRGMDVVGSGDAGTSGGGWGSFLNPTLDVNRSAMGAGVLADTVDGNGVGVAVLDSGVALHPDLLGRIAAFKDFVNGCDGIPYDDYGHGTHVAGLIAGNGLSSVLERLGTSYRGVAPRAKIVGVKVLNSRGAGRISDVISGLDWCIANKSRYNLRVINLSLSAAVTSSSATDPLCQAAERAVKAGITVVASAGNWGGVYGTVGAPGNDPLVITVGASNTAGTVARGDDKITSFTGRGPTAYDIAMKPDVLAPGNDIVSLRAPGSTIDSQYPTLTRLPGSILYAHLTGTSMSAALVSGAAALMVDANRDLTPTGVKAALMFTAQTLRGYDPATGLTTYYDPLVQGAGEVNLVGAVDMAGRMRPGVGFIGTPTLSSLIGGEAAPWAGATIPQLLSRPGLAWGDTFLWGGNTSLTIAQARQVWGSNLVWNGGDVPPPPRLWNDTLVWGDNLVWNGGDAPPPPRIFTNLVWGSNLVWNGGDVTPPTTRVFPGVVQSNNLVWNSGGDPPPPRIIDTDPSFKVGGDTQNWGGSGLSLILPDPLTGP